MVMGWSFLEHTRRLETHAVLWWCVRTIFCSVYLSMFLCIQSGWFSMGYIMHSFSFFRPMLSRVGNRYKKDLSFFKYLQKWCWWFWWNSNGVSFRTLIPFEIKPFSTRSLSFHFLSQVEFFFLILHRSRKHIWCLLFCSTWQLLRTFIYYFKFICNSKKQRKFLAD